MNRDPVERIRLKLNQAMASEEQYARDFRLLAGGRRSWSKTMLIRFLLFVPLLACLGLAGLLAWRDSPHWGYFLFVAVLFGGAIAGTVDKDDA